MRNKATRTNEWEREHFGGSPLDPFESSKGYSTDGGAAVTQRDEMVTGNQRDEMVTQRLPVTISSQRYKIVTVSLRETLRPLRLRVTGYHFIPKV